MVVECSLSFFAVASKLLDWLSICSDSGFIHSFSSVEVDQGFKILSGEVFGMRKTFLKSSEVFNMVIGWVYHGLFGLGILVLVISG